VAGYVCRVRLQLTLAGEALLAIGGALVPLAVWVVGGRDGLNWSRDELLAAATVVALPVYVACYVLAPGRAFAYLVAIAGKALLMAVLNLGGVPREWIACASVVLACIYIMFSVQLRGPRWGLLGDALFWCAQIVTPPAMLLGLGAKFAALPRGWISEPISDY